MKKIKRKKVENKMSTYKNTETKKTKTCRTMKMSCQTHKNIKKLKDILNSNIHPSLIICTFFYNITYALCLSYVNEVICI
jgi:hypothetical protein